MEDTNKSPWQQIDYTMLFLLFLMIIASSLAIYSAQLLGQYPENFVAKQLFWYVVGGIFVVGVMVLDFDQFRKLSWYVYGLGIILLAGILVAPKSIVPLINGASCWYRLGSFALQPSELMKVSLVVTLSHTIATHNEKYLVRTMREDLLLLGKIGLIVLFPMLLILKQPDLGTSLVFIAITASLLVVSGIRWRIITTLVLLFILFIVTLVWIYFNFTSFFEAHILAPYQLDRFYAWFDPYGHKDAGFQTRSALMAIGSGMLFGKGFTHGTVYMPEAQTDFIFSIIGEEWGFIGSSIVISLFFLMVYRMINTALESNEPFGSYLCTGVIGMLTFQVFQNIGMTIQVMPITGIPLPFISYGGSSIMAYMLAFGLVLNVKSRTRKYMFS